MAMAGLVLQLAIPNAVFTYSAEAASFVAEEAGTSISGEMDAEQRVIQGMITDESGMPLPGVTVREKGINNGTATDFNGNYTITIPRSGILVFSYVAFLMQKVPLNGEDRIDVVLTEDMATLDEVVVVGYGQNVRRNLTTAVSSVKPSDIPDRNVASFFNKDGVISTSVNVPEGHRLHWKHEGASYYNPDSFEWGILYGDAASYDSLPYDNIMSGSPMLIFDH